MAITRVTQRRLFTAAIVVSLVAGLFGIGSVILSFLDVATTGRTAGFIIGLLLIAVSIVNAVFWTYVRNRVTEPPA